MSKAKNQSNKLTIAKSKFCDEDFDKLVLETSHWISDKRLIDLADPILTNPKHSTLASGDSCISPNSSLSEPYSRIHQPKRPMNAFMVWGQAIRRELHHRFSNVQNALLSKALGRVWRSLGTLEKEPFVKKAHLIKENHKREYPNYKYQPRRVQDKKGKSNMLIGIHLNHPVNNCARQIDHYREVNFSGISPTYHTPEEYRPNQERYDKLKPDNSKSIYYSATETKIKIEHESNSVQTFEYNPYPNDASNMRHDRDDEQRYYWSPTTSRNVHNRNLNSESQRHPVIYPPYQQIAYDSNQQNHQQLCGNEIQVQSSYMTTINNSMIH